MAIDITTFAGFAQIQDDAIRAAMDAVITAELTAVRTPLKVLLGIYVMINFIVFACGAMGANTIIRKLVTAAAVSFFLTNTMAYSTYIRDFMFDDVPNEIATVVNGQGSQLTAAQQFDTVSKAAENLVATAQAQNAGRWSAAAIGDIISIWIASACMHITFAIQSGIWLLGRKFFGIVLCFGPWLLPFELFERTRGWVDHWFGLLVGLTTFQLASSILMQFQLRGQMSIMQYYHANPGGAMDVVNHLFEVLQYIVSDVVAMIALPAICGIGSGAAVYAVTTALMMSAPGRAARAGASAGTSAGRAGRRMWNGYRSGRNSVAASP